MLWWEDGFCRMLADAGRFVIRYDHRDTGRSVTYELGRPGYTGDAIPDDDRRREPLSSITAPTLVIHGTADPMFPIEHGEALAEAIPGARLPALHGAGHGIDRADWEPIVRAILEHTAADRPLP